MSRRGAGASGRVGRRGLRQGLIAALAWNGLGHAVVSDAVSRTYDEDEVAAILACVATKAKERASGSGMTLVELEAAASEAGLDTALVRDAAREVDRVEERPVGQHVYGSSVRLSARASVEGSVDIDALAARLFAEMADQVGEPGTQQQVGEARVWQTAWSGRGIDAPSGKSQSLTLRPTGEGAQVVLREDVEREAATGVAVRTVIGGVLGALLTFLVGDALGPVDDALAIAVLSMPVHASLGWLAGKRWWRRRRRALAQAHEARARALAKAAIPALPAAREDATSTDSDD